jgi:Xaa-Pro aminopeptidase
MTQRRIASVRRAMHNRRLDALLVSSLSHIRFLSGFSGSHALLVLRNKAAFFVTDGRYLLQSRTEVEGFRRTIAKTSLLEEVAGTRMLLRARRVGIETGSMSIAQYRNLRKLFHGMTFVPADDIVEDIATVKDAEEVGNIRRAAAISDAVFAEILDFIRPGARERDIAAEISYRQKRHGAEQDAFEPIVASGERGALPHAGATARKLRYGDMVTLDFGCSHRGYHSDLTRTVSVGKVSRRNRELYNVVLGAQLEAIKAARGGMLARDLDSVARSFIAGHGYGRFFLHSLGHGLGLEIHEGPRISARSRDRLAAGNVITIEPGVYIRGVGGVRIEDDVLVKSDGCEVLTKAPKELMIV